MFHSKGSVLDNDDLVFNPEEKNRNEKIDQRARKTTRYWRDEDSIRVKILVFFHLTLQIFLIKIISNLKNFTLSKCLGTQIAAKMKAFSYLDTDRNEFYIRRTGL